MPSGNPLGELPSLLSESSGIYYGILPHVTYIQTTRSGDRSNKINGHSRFSCFLCLIEGIDIWGGSFAIIIAYIYHMIYLKYIKILSRTRLVELLSKTLATHTHKKKEKDPS